MAERNRRKRATSLESDSAKRQQLSRECLYSLFVWCIFHIISYLSFLDNTSEGKISR